MSEKIVNWIIGVFGGLATIQFGKEILVFIISENTTNFFENSL